MSLQVRNQTSGALERVAGFNDTDSILSPSSQNPISNRAVYAALAQKIDKTVTDLINYYDKTQVYSKPEVRALIGAINTLTIEVVSALPTQDISTTTIYFVGPAPGTNNYDEYVYVGGNWVQIGDTTIDLSSYVTSSALTTVLQDYYTKSQTDALFNDYYDKDETDDLLDLKQDVLNFDTQPIAGSQNPVTSAGIKTALDNILISGNGGSIIKVHHLAGAAATGSIVTASKGSYSVSSTFDVSGDAIIIGFGEIGDITITTTNGSETGTTQINIPCFSNYSTVISYGLDYVTWLMYADINPSYYHSLDEVFADEEAVRKLMTKHASVNYLATVDRVDDEMVIAVLNNDICAKWINLRDYALDTLYANTYAKTIMDEANKYGYGEWALIPQVPIMTSNTAPYGEVSASGVYNSNYHEYWAFNNSSSGWQSNIVSSTTATWLQYKFTEPKIITTVYLDSQGSGPHIELFNPYSVTIQGSNNGTTWKSFITYDIATPAEGKGFRSFENDTAYLYYRLLYNNPNFYQGGNYYNVAMNIQFYAWGPKGNVPIMTSNTAPYGTVSANSVYSSVSAAWQAFGSDTTKGWLTQVYDNASISYNFTNPVCVRKVKLCNYAYDSTTDSRLKNFKVQGSNNNSTWVDIYTGLYPNDATKNIPHYYDFDNNDYYMYYRVLIIDTYNNAKYAGASQIQFYGREMKVSVPIMTSDTAPYGSTISSTTLAGSYYKYKAFDNDDTTPSSAQLSDWYPNATTSCNEYIGYCFTSPVNINFVSAVTRNWGGTSYYPSYDVNVRLAYSNDGITWVEIEQDIPLKTDIYTNITIPNNINAKYWSLRYLGYNRGWADQNKKGCIMNKLQFYGFDYSEYDWDTENPRHYLYDHGVELDEFIINVTNASNASVTKAPNQLLYKTSAVTYTIAQTYKNIDLSDYDLVYINTGDSLYNSGGNTGANIFGAIVVSNAILDGNYSGTLVNAQFNTDTGLPYRISANVSSINETKYLSVVTGNKTAGQTRTITINEWWLE